MNYTRGEVELLLPTVWDPDSIWGAPTEGAPEPGMPKGKSKDPRRTNAFWDHMLDVQIAWQRAPLTTAERRALLLRYGADMTQEQIARVLGRAKSTINENLYRGVGRIVAYLNGEEWKETLD